MILHEEQGLALQNDPYSPRQQIKFNVSGSESGHNTSQSLFTQIY